MSSESEASTELNFEETKLTLGLPGKSGLKRVFSEANIDLNLERSSGDDGYCNSVVINDEFSSTKSRPSKVQVVGWPPVRASRRNATRSCKYIKVGLDGAPYLRKVDLEIYESYHQLLVALQHMFSSCLTIRNYVNEERKLVDHLNGMEYLPTYEDKDGDWMLVGDVPWKMFVDSCKRLRLMKSSEAIGLSSKDTSN